MEEKNVTFTLEQFDDAVTAELDHLLDKAKENQNVITGAISSMLAIAFAAGVRGRLTETEETEKTEETEETEEQ